MAFSPYTFCLTVATLVWFLSSPLLTDNPQGPFFRASEKINAAADHHS
ncbi:MAG: hypothetical protein BWY83_00924 [bacterium ADurb.Bin478]|nr:MAG: hypothetical protein BWY83_00924 [bacterium ADurb.Bin478]